MHRQILTEAGGKISKAIDFCLRMLYNIPVGKKKKQSKGEQKCWFPQRRC
jgi:hypothetical protein